MSRLPARAPRRPFLVATAACLVVSTPAVASVRRDALDDAEVERMSAVSPHARALLEQGEAAGSEGKLALAVTLFRSAAEEYRGGSLLERRLCEALTALGQRKEATQACSRALEGARSNANVRAAVRALVAGPTAPRMLETSMALDLAKKALDRAPGQFTPLAARCDIAASLGDGIMLEDCFSRLRPIAPDAREVRNAESLLDARAVPARYWALWLFALTAMLTTLAHAAWRGTASRRARRFLSGGALVLAMTASASAPAIAAVPGQQPGMLSKWPIDDDNPEASIPNETERNRDPLEFGYWLQDVILRAEVYANHGKHDMAVKLYRALAVAVPDRAIAFTKMCDEYEALGDREKATASCEAALLRDGLMVKDYEHYVHLVLSKAGPLTERQAKALSEVLAHLRKDPAGVLAADDLGCEIGARTGDSVELAACVARRTASAPHTADTLSYEWALAMTRGNESEARLRLDQARDSGMSKERLEDMERAMAEQARHYRARIFFAGAALLTFLSAAAFALLRSGRRRSTLDAV